MCEGTGSEAGEREPERHDGSRPLGHASVPSPAAAGGAGHGVRRYWRRHAVEDLGGEVGHGFQRLDSQLTGEERGVCFEYPARST